MLGSAAFFLVALEMSPARAPRTHDGPTPARPTAFLMNVQGETLATSDRRKMIAFISSQLPHAERTIVLGNGKGGQVIAHVTVVGDGIEIASNFLEWAS